MGKNEMKAIWISVWQYKELTQRRERMSKDKHRSVSYSEVIEELL